MNFLTKVATFFGLHDMDDEREYLRRINTYKFNGILIPDLYKTSVPLLRHTLEASNFMAPATIDARDYCPPTSDQGATSMCAAYTAAHWASNIRWRKDDVLTIYDPAKIYQAAKKIDRFPDRDGTTLDAVLAVIRDELNLFPKTCEIQYIDAYNARATIKYAVHKFGAVLGAFHITSEWMRCNADKVVIDGEFDPVTVGGHAVLICGYNQHGVIIQNSWGEKFGAYGYATITWKEFDKQFAYGAVLTNCLDGLRMH